jgi:hypothetical protein
MTTWSKIDVDALERAIKWCRRYQRGKMIEMVRSPLPPPGSEAWFVEAEHCAAKAQALSLPLKPWECPPASVYDDGQFADCYGRRPDEVRLLRKMIALGVSRYEPDVPCAIELAEREQRPKPRLNHSGRPRAHMPPITLPPVAEPES